MPIHPKDKRVATEADSGLWEKFERFRWTAGFFVALAILVKAALDGTLLSGQLFVSAALFYVLMFGFFWLVGELAKSQTKPKKLY